jgi:hypothetical protein
MLEQKTVAILLNSINIKCVNFLLLLFNREQAKMNHLIALEVAYIS